MIEFPPGSTILLPSAVISHSNVPIQPNETRYSWTQFSAGGLFRWVEHGFQVEEKFKADLDKSQLIRERKERVEHALSFWSTLEDLHSLFKNT